MHNQGRGGEHETDGKSQPTAPPALGRALLSDLTALFLMLWRRAQVFPKRWTVHSSQGKLHSFELLCQLEGDYVLCEQTFQSEIMLMPHPPASALTPPGNCVESALFCLQNMLELKLLLGWSFEFGDLGTPGSPVAYWAPTMCQALGLLHVHT